MFFFYCACWRFRWRAVPFKNKPSHSRKADYISRLILLNLAVPLSESKLLSPLLVEVQLPSFWQLNIAFQGNKITKLFSLTFQKINHEKLEILTTHNHSLSHNGETSLGKKKNYGYIEPIHITIPCPHFSDSFVI